MINPEDFKDCGNSTLREEYCRSNQLIDLMMSFGLNIQPEFKRWREACKAELIKRTGDYPKGYEP